MNLASPHSSGTRSSHRARIGAVCLCLGVIAATQAIRAQAVSSNSVVIRDASLIDVRTGEISPHRTVVIEGRRIVRIGPAAAIKPPAKAHIIDGRGKYLIPGLIDTHVHLFGPWRRNWPDTLAQFGWILASGVTTVRDAGASGLEANYASLRAANDSGRIMTPRIRISLGAPRSRTPDELQTKRAALAQFKSRGIDHIKLMGEPRAEALETIRAARAAGLPVYGHTWEDYDDSFLESTSFTMAAVRAGISGITHNRYRMTKDTLLPNAGPRLTRSSSPAQVLSATLYALTGWFDVVQVGQRALIDTMLNRGTWYEPTLGAGFPAICTRPLDQALLRRYLPFDTDRPIAEPTPAQADTVKRACEGKRQFVRRFYEAGVPIVTGSDNEGFPPRGITREMRLLAEAGIPPLGVLQAATINAARALEVDGDIGTVEEGKLADLVLLDANPLTDITNIGRIAAVLANGRIVDRSRLLARVGTTPPMVSFDDRLDRLDEDLKELAFQHPDSVVEVFIQTDGTMRPQDLRGVAPDHSPIRILGVDGRVIRARTPAFALRITSRIRFVVRIQLADTTRWRP